MNYLAHLFLSGSDEEILLGNFLGDYVRNRDLPKFPQGVQAGIRLHRAIDTFTDRHPLVLQGVRRLYPGHGRYGAVIVDVFYDYLLARNWEQFSGEDFDAFRQRVYAVLLEGRAMMRPAMQARVENMTTGDWLATYARLEGIAHSIDRMKRRASQPDRLEGAIETLSRHMAAYDNEFNGFFPEVIQYVDARLGR